ncbi:uncharacterized protein BDW70DRAFT_131688 [Aspergillus foveolatus]|uniref:uncharacterized protein n=1 Tax=Aspergillus foveolatus TaxID=210207 RepID=UPI003CCDE4DF
MPSLLLHYETWSSLSSLPRAGTALPVSASFLFIIASPIITCLSRASSILLDG